MITGLILTILLVFLDVLLGFLPTGTLDSSVTTAINWFFQYAHGFDFILPVSTMIQVFIWSMTFELAVLLFNFIHFIYNKIRGI